MQCRISDYGSDLHRASTPCAPLLATRTAAPTSAVAVAQAPVPTVLNPSFSSILIQPHTRIGETPTRTHAMATSQLLDYSSGATSSGRPCTVSALDGPGSRAQLSSRGVGCQGYVGQGAMPAGQYFECDFDWAEHARAVRHLVEAQQAEALALRLLRLGGALRGSGEGTTQQQARCPQPQQQQEELEDTEIPRSAGAAACNSSATPSSSSQDTSTAAAAASQPPPPPPQLQSNSLTAHPTMQQHSCTSESSSKSRPRSRSCSSGGSSTGTPRKSATLAAGAPPDDDVIAAAAATRTATVPGNSNGGDSCSRSSSNRRVIPGASHSEGGGVYEGARWEEFYQSHPSARFFKERRYLLLEFPDLLRCEHVAEIGCGCGSSILPVLKANQAARTTCTDISTTCLRQLVDAASAEGIDPARICVFPADATDPAAAPAFDGIDADALLIMFTLSAVTPEQQHVMLSHAWRALRPGGRLVLRDHGLYDMVQLRIPAEQWVGTNLYKRGDGTMAYFFSTEELTGRAAGAGFNTLECKYVTVINRNRKTGIELRRVFVHGVFKKPAAAGM